MPGGLSARQAYPAPPQKTRAMPFVWLIIESDVEGFSSPLSSRTAKRSEPIRDPCTPVLLIIQQQLADRDSWVPALAPAVLGRDDDNGISARIEKTSEHQLLKRWHPTGSQKIRAMTRAGITNKFRRRAQAAAASITAMAGCLVGKARASFKPARSNSREYSSSVRSRPPFSNMTCRSSQRPGAGVASVGSGASSTITRALGNIARRIF